MKSKEFKEDKEYRLYCLKHFGKKYGWRFIKESENSIEYENIIFDDKQAANVNLKITIEPITIETTLTHPFKGETILLREGNLSMNMVEKIFNNPRKHTYKEVRSKYL